MLGIASGGVPAAAIVARKLGLPLDVVIIKRLFVDNGPTSVVCATSVGGSVVIDELSPRMNEFPSLDSFVDFSLGELARRQNTCRGKRPVAELNGKHVILVDNGVHTGGTMLCAIRAVRKFQQVRITAAAPVVAADSRAAVESATDAFISLIVSNKFGHAGLWYSDFTKPSDEEIYCLLSGSA